MASKDYTYTLAIAIATSEFKVTVTDLKNH